MRENINKTNAGNLSEYQMYKKNQLLAHLNIWKL